jgi:hypothetical protein
LNEFSNWDSLPLLLKVKDTAKLLGYGTARIRVLCNANAIPCMRLGRAFVIPKEQLQLWIAKTCSDNASATFGGNPLT